MKSYPRDPLFREKGVPSGSLPKNFETGTQGVSGLKAQGDDGSAHYL